MHYKLALSIREACEAAGIGRTVLYEEIAKGRLLAYKRGRRTLIKACDLEQWLNELPRARPGATPPFQNTDRVGEAHYDD